MRGNEIREMQKQIGKYKIYLTIIHTPFKENETGRVFDFQLNVICLIKSLCCCCCGCCCCCCCYLSYQWSMLLLLLLLLLLFILSRVYVIVVIIICLIKGQYGCWCCWLLVVGVVVGICLCSHVFIFNINQ